jgi:hypothetical protein
MLGNGKGHGGASRTAVKGAEVLAEWMVAWGGL